MLLWLQPKAASESSPVGCVHGARIFVGWDSVPTGSGRVGSSRRPNLRWLRAEAALGSLATPPTLIRLNNRLS